ncbi:hypothetical protein VNO78_06010 [Psophocarpus tetragonolobus]|uniref:Uncharacterized protein n=1 Tax=Psophocarpus tetragonolobus TaxID=3891 RepID=A0AAN9T0R8_PSOTE
MGGGVSWNVDVHIHNASDEGSNLKRERNGKGCKIWLVQKVGAGKLNRGFQIPVIESTDFVPSEPAKHDNFLSILHHNNAQILIP